MTFIDDRIVTCVSVQQRDFGEPLDDVIVDFKGIEKKSLALADTFAPKGLYLSAQGNTLRTTQRKAIKRKEKIHVSSSKRRGT